MLGGIQKLWKEYEEKRMRMNAVREDLDKQ